MTKIKQIKIRVNDKAHKCYAMLGLKDSIRLYIEKSNHTYESIKCTRIDDKNDGVYIFDIDDKIYKQYLTKQVFIGLDSTTTATIKNHLQQQFTYNKGFSSIATNLCQINMLAAMCDCDIIPYEFTPIKQHINIGIIKAYKQENGKFIYDDSSLSNPHNEIYTIDIEQEIQLRAFVYEGQRTRVEKDKVTDSNTQQKRDYKEEQGNITKTIKDISSNEAQKIKWAFKLSNYDNIELNPLLQKDEKDFIQLKQRGDKIQFTLKDILKDNAQVNNLADKTITFFAYVNSLASNIYSESYQINHNTREYERIVKQDRVTSIELKIIETRFSLDFDGQTLQFLENKRIIGEWNARSGMAIENTEIKNIISNDRQKTKTIEKRAKNRLSVKYDSTHSFYYDTDITANHKPLKENDKDKRYFVKVNTKDFAFIDSLTNKHILNIYDDSDSVISQINAESPKIFSKDDNTTNTNINVLGNHGVAFFTTLYNTLIKNIKSYNTINIPLNVKYQKRILILIERFKETAESTLARMNIFIDGKRVDSKGKFIEKPTAQGTKEYEIFNPFLLPNDKNNFAYILDRPGPDCIKSGINLRIPEGRYDAKWHSSSLRQRVLRLHNNFVSYDRAILIHEGYKSSISPRNSKGCLIIGKERVKDKNNPNLWADNILKADENHSKKEALAKAIEQKGFINSYLAKSKGRDKISANEVVENIEVRIRNKFTLSHCANIENNITKINNEDGIHLFSIERKNIGKCELSAKELYKIKGIHWFETTADNYHKLLYVNPDLKDREKCKELGLLYFTWREVVEFAESMSPNINYTDSKKDEKFINYAILYARKNKGDWKEVDDGAKGYLLVSMEGIPYWADAVGQIPYAINIYKGFLQLTQNKVKAKNATINMGYAFYDGKQEGLSIAYDKHWLSRKISVVEAIPAYFGLKKITDIYFLDDVYDYNEAIVKEFESNSYDNKMILRGINYGMNPYIDLDLDSDGKNIK